MMLFMILGSKEQLTTFGAIINIISNYTLKVISKQYHEDRVRDKP